MKNIDIINLYQSINSNEDIKKLSGIKLSLLLLQNSDILENYIKTLQKTVEPTEKYNVYEQKRVELCEKYAIKNEDGTPKTKNVNGNIEFDINQTDEFNENMKKLNDEFSETIKDHNKKINEYNSFMFEDADIALKQINSELLPDNVTYEILKILKPILIIKEESEN